jgi:hypothetical protein
MNIIRLIKHDRFGIQSRAICLCFILSVSIQEVFAEKRYDGESIPIKYKIIKYHEDKNDYKFLGLTKCQSSIKISTDQTVIVCRKKALDTKTDYGLRLLLINLSKSEPIINDYSQGVQDAYYVKLTGFAKNDLIKPELILAEYGAEYSYGVDLFTLRKKKLNYLGTIDEVVNIDENVGSVVPYIAIYESAGEIRINFIRDVLKINKQGEYISVPKERIKYIVSQQGGFHKEETTHK